MKNTKHFLFQKPDAEDFYDVQTQNSNMDSIDEELYKTQEALEKKVDKVSGKGLSTNDYTTAEKQKLAGIADGANKTTVDSALSSTSTNPLQNKVVTNKLENMDYIALAESLGWKRTTIITGNWTDFSNSVYVASIPPSDFQHGDTIIIKLNNGSIHKLIGSKTAQSSVYGGTVLIGEDIPTASNSNIGTDVITGKKAWITDTNGCYSHKDGAPVAISTSQDVVAWYCNISNSSTVKNIISDSTAITEKGQYALDAVELNASVKDTLAYQIATANKGLEERVTRCDLSSVDSSQPWLSLKEYVGDLPINEPVIGRIGRDACYWGYINYTSKKGRFILITDNMGLYNVRCTSLTTDSWYYSKITTDSETTF